MIVLVLACRPEDPGPDPADDGAPIRVVSGPVLTDGLNTPLSRRLAVETDIPTAIGLRLASSDGDLLDVVFPGFATAHDVPVLGLEPDEDWSIGVRLTAEDGRTEALPEIQVHTAPLPASFPVLELLARDAERAAGGYWLVPLEIPDRWFWLAIVDSTDLEVVWLYDGPINWGDVRMSEAGTILGLYGAAVELDLTGEILRTWTREPSGVAEAFPIPWSLNHELYPMPDGSFWSLAPGSVEVPAYPTRYDDPAAIAPARIADARVVHFAADGAVLSDWPLSERLDTSRIGFDSLDLLDAGYDWVHANAVIPDGDGVIAALRHQDCLVRLGPDGEVDWILGDPAGWSGAVAEELLTPTAGTEWPYHLHGPHLDDDGQLWVFDNRTVEATPYAAAPPSPGPSRVVAYRIEGREVSQVAEWRPPVVLRSNALGSVHTLPGSPNLVVDFGMLFAEGDVRNVQEGRGVNSTRILEIDPADPVPVVDVRISTDRAVEPGGVNVYRLVPVASLYPPGVVVSREPSAVRRQR